MAREHWGSRIGVILAVAGSAVGLGNFLRFPGNAAQNGGGAFMLPYFISLLVLGIPLCWAEWTMGRYAGTRGFNSAPAIYTAIWRNRAAKYFGGLALLIPLVIYMYYVLIEAWCLGYAINYLTGDLLTGTGGQVDALIAEAQRKAEVPLSAEQARAAGFGAFFGNFVGDSEHGALFQGRNAIWLAVLAAVFLLNFYFIYRGVAKGIEVLCKIAMPLMVLLALIVLVRVLTLGTPDPTRPDQSVIGGLGFMWNPRPDKLADPQTWLAASGQIFFSLSVGFGIIVNYASYLRERDDVVLSGLTSSSMNEFFEVCLGGLITLPAAFVFLGMAVEGFAGSTFALGFVALPNVFDVMWGGRFFGFLWFFMLFIAAVTSSVSMLQPVIAFFEEGFGLKRHAAAAILGLVAALGCGFVVYFSKDLLALDMFDFWVGSVLIFVLAMAQAILYGWVFGIHRGHAEAHRGAHIRIPWFVQLMLKYVVPVYLLVIFVAFCWQKLPSSDSLLFETDAVLTARLAANGSVSDELRAAFSENGVELPADVSIAPRAEGGPWVIRDKEGATLYVLGRERRTEQLVVTRDGAPVLETGVVNARPMADQLRAGRVPQGLHRALADRAIELPDPAKVAAGPSGTWTIEEDGEPRLVVRLVESDAPADVLAVNEHSAGYVERIARNPVALSSVLFLSAILAFLMLLIHIAGRRWEAEGRFAHLDNDDTLSQPGGTP